LARSVHTEKPREARPGPVAGNGRSPREFPVERFANTEMWINAHSAKVRRSIVAINS